MPCPQGAGQGRSHGSTGDTGVLGSRLNFRVGVAGEISLAISIRLLAVRWNIVIA